MSLSAPVLSSEVELQGLRTLYQLLASLARAKSLQDVYECALTSLLASTAADRAAILTFDAAGVMRFQAWRNLSEQYRNARTGNTLWREGTRNVEPVLVADVALDPELASSRELFSAEGIRSLAFIPLELDTGVFGKFVLYCRDPHQWMSDELALAQMIAHHVALVLERKRADLARGASEQLLQSILDNSGTVIFHKDVNGRYRLVNRLFQDLFHVRRADVVGKTDYEIFPPEIAARFQENDRKALASGAPISAEEAVSQEDGVHTYLSVKFPIQDSDGTVVGVCGIATDITERQSLEVSHRRLAAVVENSYDAIITKDLTGIITSWNKAAEDLLGYTASEAVGQPIWLIAPPDRRNEMLMILGRISRGERVEHFETRRKTKDGRILDVSLTVSPIRDREGRIVGASKILRDITHRKRAEEERKLLLAREQEARNTAELLNQVGPRLLLERDPERLVQAVADMARAVVGAQVGAFFRNVVNEKGESYVVGALSGELRDSFAGGPIPRDTPLLSPTFHDKKIVRCADITQDPRYGQALPLFGMPKDSPVRSYLAAPVISRSGEAIGALVFGHSIPGKFTDLHEALVQGIAAQAGIAMDNARLFEQAQWAQNELKRSNEELRRINEDLEVFAYSASHDLQEPLRTITLSSELLQRSFTDQLSGDAGKFLDGIHHAARTMANLITDLLAYTTAAKSAEGPPPLTDAEKVFNQVLQTMSANIEREGATVTSVSLPMVPIHESRLVQVFQNLIGNALKYRSKEAPRVFVSAIEQDGWTVFSVKDNGIGIEPEYGNQVFGLFKRLHNRKEYPGSGLGLAICQRIIEQYGGRIWLDQSALGAGSTFCFSLPARSQ